MGRQNERDKDLQYIVEAPDNTLIVISHGTNPRLMC